MRRKAPAKPLRVCVLSSHPLVLDEFSRLLAAARIHARAQRLDSAPPAKRPQPAAPRAQVYVLDAHAPQPVSEARLQDLRAARPRARVVVLADKFSEPAVFAFLRLGARGLLTYSDARRQLPAALRAIAAGGLWVPRAWLSRFVERICGARDAVRAAPLARTSRREQQVLDALLENLANKEIASRLNISERTVKFHVSNLLAKYGLRRRADLILQSFQMRSSG